MVTMTKYDFLVETWRTERLKTLSVWSQIPDARMQCRPEPRARTPLEHMVHQCVSEDAWMRSMLGIDLSPSTLPAQETKLEFIRHYAARSAQSLRALESKPEAWFEGVTQFFDVPRSRAWVLTRRFTHSAHHRGQLAACLRLWGEALYSTFGPTADTGGLPRNGARVIYRYESVEDLLDGESEGGRVPELPEVGPLPVTERPSNPDALDAVVAAPAHHTVLLENQHVRVLDTRIAPGETVPLHTHRWPSVLHVLSWSDIVRRDELGSVVLDTRAVPMTSAQVAWSPALPPHTLENVGSKDIHIVSLELKDAGTGCP